MGHGGVKTNTGGGRRDLARASRDKHELTTMVGALGVAVCLKAVAVVAVK